MASPGMDYKGRQQRLRSALALHRLDALLVTHLPNILYLCGFHGSAGVLLVPDSKSVFFTDGRYTTQARSEVEGARIVIASKASVDSGRRMAGQAGQEEGLNVVHSSRRVRIFRVGIDGERLPVVGAKPPGCCTAFEFPPARGAQSGGAGSHGEGRAGDSTHSSGGPDGRRPF